MARSSAPIIFPIFHRYLITEFPGGSLLRIEPVRKKRDDAYFECVAENGVGDEVSAKVQLEVLDGEIAISVWVVGMHDSTQKHPLTRGRIHKVKNV